MKSKPKSRDCLYLCRCQEEMDGFYSYGIEFHEFIACVHSRPENLILLKHQFGDAQWNRHTRLDYVTKQELPELLEDNVYGYGDFCWVDIRREEDLDQLNDSQVAQLLFFGHLAKPLNGIPMERFAYYAHDDGWFNKLYVARVEDYAGMLARCIPFKLRNLYKRDCADLPVNLADALVQTAADGWVIDFAKARLSRTQIQLPLTTIGFYTDMDQMFERKGQIKESDRWLVYSQRRWQLSTEEPRRT
ncbi:hypothetical protein [Gorillibacterium sp. sgz500922]|uniref:hypothetical protein n=1 Tax=Gorillibacterium sp. sgz500922 TaxID=3446694 RepID=UPI003F6653ED